MQKWGQVQTPPLWKSCFLSWALECRNLFWPVSNDCPLLKCFTSNLFRMNIISSHRGRNHWFQCNNKMERIKERQRAEPILLELLETVVGSVHSPENKLFPLFPSIFHFCFPCVSLILSIFHFSIFFPYVSLTWIGGWWSSSDPVLVAELSAASANRARLQKINEYS